MTRPFLLACALLAGCATTEPPEKVRLYESVTGAPQIAAVVKRLWVDSWGSALVTPTYASIEEGAADLRENAASLGGDGVINFGCYRMGDAVDAPLKCNGTVVRFKQ